MMKYEETLEHLKNMVGTLGGHWSLVHWVDLLERQFRIKKLPAEKQPVEANRIRREILHLHGQTHSFAPDLAIRAAAHGIRMQKGSFKLGRFNYVGGKIELETLCDGLEKDWMADIPAVKEGISKIIGGLVK